MFINGASAWKVRISNKCFDVDLDLHDVFFFLIGFSLFDIPGSYVFATVASRVLHKAQSV